MPERLTRLHAVLVRSRDWALSGSLVGWGNPMVPLFDLVVFLILAPELRMARLRAREAARYGARIAPGGDMVADHRIFMEWAEAYDSAGPDQRSRVMHEQWVGALPCRVLRLDSARPLGELEDEVLSAVR